MAEAVIETQSSAGIAHGFQGQLYQVAVAMLLTVRGTLRNYENFRLETEVDEAKKFDDVVLDEGCGNYTIIQLKHLTTLKKTAITDVYLFRNMKENFSLLKYVCSYLEAKKEQKFSMNATIKNAYILTNIGLDVDETGQGLKLKSQQKDFRKLYGKLDRVLVKEVTLDDNEIVKVLRSDGASKYYKFTGDEVVIILMKLARTLLKTPEKDKKRDLQGFEATLKSLTEDEIKESLDKIIYGVKQPDDEEIFEIVKQELLDRSQVETSENVLDKLKTELIKWATFKTEPPFGSVIEFETANKFIKSGLKDENHFEEHYKPHFQIPAIKDMEPCHIADGLIMGYDNLIDRVIDDTAIKQTFGAIRELKKHKTVKTLTPKLIEYAKVCVASDQPLEKLEEDTIRTFNQIKKDGSLDRFIDSLSQEIQDKGTPLGNFFFNFGKK